MDGRVAYQLINFNVPVLKDGIRRKVLGYDGTLEDWILPV